MDVRLCQWQAGNITKEVSEKESSSGGNNFKSNDMTSKVSEFWLRKLIRQVCCSHFVVSRCKFLLSQAIAFILVPATSRNKGVSSPHYSLYKMSPSLVFSKYRILMSVIFGIKSTAEYPASDNPNYQVLVDAYRRYRRDYAAVRICEFYF